MLTLTTQTKTLLIQSISRFQAFLFLSREAFQDLKLREKYLFQDINQATEQQYSSKKPKNKHHVQPDWKQYSYKENASCKKLWFWVCFSQLFGFLCCMWTRWAIRQGEYLNYRFLFSSCLPWLRVTVLSLEHHFSSLLPFFLISGRWRHKSRPLWDLSFSSVFKLEQETNVGLQVPCRYGGKCGGMAFFSNRCTIQTNYDTWVSVCESSQASTKTNRRQHLESINYNLQYTVITVHPAHTGHQNKGTAQLNSACSSAFMHN